LLSIILYIDKARSENKWNVLIGMIVGKMVKFGKLPVKIQAGRAGNQILVACPTCRSGGPLSPDRKRRELSPDKRRRGLYSLNFISALILKPL